MYYGYYPHARNCTRSVQHKHWDAYEQLNTDSANATFETLTCDLIKNRERERERQREGDSHILPTDIISDGD